MAETGGTLAATELGSGEPLVLINGYGATKADWDPGFLEALAESSKLLCPDNRAMGESPPLAGELTIAGMAADVLALMDERGIEAAAVAGWSMGGFIAQELAAMAPERVTHLILMSTSLSGAEAIPAERGVFARLTDHSGTPREQASRLIGLLFPPDLAPAIDEQFGDLVAEAKAALSHEALDAQEKAIRSWHDDAVAEQLARITAPVLAAAGSEDIVIPAANSALLAERLPDSWLARFPGAGHAFMAQEPRRLAALIGAFAGR